jgi:hypothetical protein
MQSPSSLAPMSPSNLRSPSSMSFNIHAKPFIPQEVLDEMKWFETKVEEFKKFNKFIFEEEEDLKFILSLENTPFENVQGERFKQKPKFKPTLSPLKDVKSWADVVVTSTEACMM